MKFIKIYDLKKNILFETADVTVEILDDGSGIDEFLAEAKKLVDDKPTPASYSGYYNGDYYGGSYYGAYGGRYGKTDDKSSGSNEKSKEEQKTDNKVIPFADVKKNDDSNPGKYGKNGKRRGKRKKKGNIDSSNDASTDATQLTFLDDGYDDPYGYGDNRQW